MIRNRPICAVVLPRRAPGDSLALLHAVGPTGRFLPVVVLLDTGSDTSLLTQRTAQALGLPVDRSANEFQPMNTVGREAILYLPTVMHFIVGLDQGSPVGVSVHGGVAAEKSLSRDLVGRDFLNQFEVTWKRDVIELTPGWEDQQ